MERRGFAAPAAGGRPRDPWQDGLTAFTVDIGQSSPLRCHHGRTAGQSRWVILNTLLKLHLHNGHYGNTPEPVSHNGTLCKAAWRPPRGPGRAGPSLFGQGAQPPLGGLLRRMLSPAGEQTT